MSRSNIDRQACTVQVEEARSFTDVDYGKHMKADRKTEGDAHRRVVKYLPSSDSSELSKRLVHLHLSLRLHHHHHQQQQQ